MLGSSISSIFGRLISPREIASICCSPPESVPARWSRRSYRTGKALDLLLGGAARRAAVEAEAAEQQVVEDGLVAEDLAALGDVRQAAAHDLVAAAGW